MVINHDKPLMVVQMIMLINNTNWPLYWLIVELYLRIWSDININLYQSTTDDNINGILMEYQWNIGWTWMEDVQNSNDYNGIKIDYTSWWID